METRQHLPQARSERTKPVAVRVATKTDVGRVREHNEDSHLVVELAGGNRQLAKIGRIGPTGILLCVCDGMGGAAAGEVASSIAVEAIASSLVKTSAFVARDEFAKALVEAVVNAGREIRRNARTHPERQGMGTTCTAAVFRNEELLVAQVGDSRAYVMREGALVQITKDQNLVGHLVELGHLKPEEAEHAPGSNVVLQALGTTEEIQVELTVARLRRGDRVLLCSDGLSALIPHSTVQRVLRQETDPQKACRHLVDLANEAGGRDNITVVIGEFYGEGLVQAHRGEGVEHGRFDPNAAPFVGPEIPVPFSYSLRKVVGMAIGLFIAAIVVLRLAQAEENLPVAAPRERAPAMQPMPRLAPAPPLESVIRPAPEPPAPDHQIPEPLPTPPTPLPKRAALPTSIEPAASSAPANRPAREPIVPWGDPSSVEANPFK